MKKKMISRNVCYKRDSKKKKDLIICAMVKKNFISISRKDGEGGVKSITYVFVDFQAFRELFENVFPNGYSVQSFCHNSYICKF